MSFTFSPASANVYQTVTGTLVFNNNDVKKLFIDWGDNSDRTLENGINQWIDIEKPFKTQTVTHTYSKTGTFSPIIRTVNTQGFVSKYYGREASNADLRPYESVGTRINNITISDDTPIGVMKIENKTVLSGIDNNIFENGAKTVYIQPAPLIASGTSSDLVNVDLKIKVDCVVVQPNNTSFADLGSEAAVETITKTFKLNDRISPSAPVPLASQPILKILKVTLVTAKLDVSDELINEFNKLKIFLTALGDDGNSYPITYISNGDPVKKLDDNKRYAKLDFTQSRAQASNVSLSNYYYDSGKVFWEPSFQWQASSSTQLTNATKTTDSLIKKQYTYYVRPDGLKGRDYINTVSNSAALYSGNAWLYDGEKYDYVRDQFLLNEFNQFYDTDHLTRMQTTTASSKTNPISVFDVVYRFHPPINSTGTTAYFLNGKEDTQDLTTMAYSNTSSYPVSTSGWGGDFLNSAGGAREASSYFIIGSTQKQNKIWINNSSYAENLESNLSGMQGNVVRGVYYLKISNVKVGDKFTQKCEWVPLDFEDTTKVEKIYRDANSKEYITKTNSFVKSGYITFDMPNDWSKLSTLDNYAGGFFNVSGAANSVTNVSNDYSKGLENLTRKTKISQTPFDYIPLSGASVGTTLSGYTDNDIGSFKYIFQFSGSTSDGEVHWVASSSIADNRIYLAATSSAGFPATMSGFIRRVNLYDIFDGASKTSDYGEPPNFVSSPGGSYSYNFMFGDVQSFPKVFDLRPSTVSGSMNNLYPIKIVLSGTTLDNSTGSSTPPNQEIWNILPFTSSSAQVVTQKDNTAYDLNYMAVTSDLSITYAGTYYQAISKGGNVFIVRTGTPIQTLSFGGTAMGDETNFANSADYTSYYTLRKLRRAQSNQARVMWDEQQKDGTYVRFFGFVTNVTETHKITGKRATKPYTFTMVVDSICLIDSGGNIMSDVEPLGGIPDARQFI